VIAFAYQDEGGARTVREIQAQAIEGALLHGWCLLRDEYRTFRIDRIDGHITDTRTGEMVAPWEWARRWRT
jgi:predicted DNA-binding transcriptional regulator YafY